MSLRLRLVLLSALMLFVELALIRWTGSNVVYLGYFSNFILLGSFLGIGIGFLRAGDRRNLLAAAPVALVFFVGFVLIFPVEVDRRGADVIYFGALTRTGTLLHLTGLPVWVMLPIIFTAVAGIMALIAHGVAQTFVRFQPLEAYRLDITGSLLGIAGFALLSLAGAPPVAWGLATAAVFAVLLGRDMRVLQAAALVGLVLILGRESLLPNHGWSPYYKVHRLEALRGGEQEWDITVNGIPFQSVRSVAARREREPIYLLPYSIVQSPPANVLVIGAGNGGDVAIALAEGADHVDAVEIDPHLYELGESLNPDEPYQDPRVEVHITDGRAFLEATDRRYDLIVLAMPDSMTLVAGQSSLRLESYLFTVDAFRAAREHLAEGGAFTMYNYYREDWLIDRLASTLTAAFGHAPCVSSVGEVGRLAILTVGLDEDDVDCTDRWRPVASSVVQPTTDDYPFLYLRDRAIPGFYLLTIGLILVASVAIVRVTAGPLRGMRSYADLFLMGAAFLLLETKSVVQFALLFGTTWFVNALVFAGILLSVLAAIEVTRRFQLPRPAVLYAAVLIAVGVSWLVPASALLDLPFWPRFVAATLFWFTPVFLANVVFAQRFKQVSTSNVAFGANLLGAMVGGLIEYAALVTGYQALAVFVAALYAGAFLLTRTQGHPPRPASV